MGESEADETERLWPDDLELGDTFEFDGNTYEVAGTGPGEATADRVDNSEITLEVFRWAVTDAVGIELETSLTQEEFGRSVLADSDQ